MEQNDRVGIGIPTRSAVEIQVVDSISVVTSGNPVRSLREGLRYGVAVLVHLVAPDATPLDRQMKCKIALILATRRIEHVVEMAERHDMIVVRDEIE